MDRETNKETLLVPSAQDAIVTKTKDFDGKTHKYWWKFAKTSVGI